MNFTSLKIPGAYLIELDLKEDERGFFARAYCEDTFEKKGLNSCWVQCNISFNIKEGTLRGMHFQRDPHPEIKIVRCTSGAIYDVILDLRQDSPTFKQWVAYELSEKNHRILYIPAGCAHGFQTLEDNTEVFYQMSTAYFPECASGVRWNDPAFGIQWANPVNAISEKDQLYANFT